ncbi:MAG: hypothetical protein NTX85_01345 [Candidatus Nomurabacteria bacterium]|nr:hypothetical protein [Candidatus Nomurabacteria bacterium]
METNKLVYGHKLGGATAGHAPYLNELIESLGNSQYSNCNIFIVCSAFARVTRQLDAIFDIIFMDVLNIDQKNKLINEWLFEFRGTHTDIIKTLFGKKKNFDEVNSDFNSEYKSLHRLITNALNNKFDKYLRTDDEKHSYLHASMLKYGEICSTKILAHYLDIYRFNYQYIDSREFMKTNFKTSDELSLEFNHTDVKLDFKETSDLISSKFSAAFNQSKIVICSGFISQDSNTGDCTTLGYDGSDYTAAVISSALKAESLSLWKDVDGVKTNDPDVDPDAELIYEITHDGLISLCEENGKWPVRRDCVELCRDSKVTIYLRPSSNVKSKGTKICSNY